MRALYLVCALAIVVLGLGGTASADIVKEIVSSDFTFAFGATDNSTTATWTLELPETQGNTPMTQGDFTLSPAPLGSTFSGYGPQFPARTLTYGPNLYSAEIDGGGGFSVPITASYDGSAPADASSTPNYQLKLEITGISVYGMAYSSTSSLQTMTLEETTSSHAQTSSTIDLLAGDGTLDGLNVVANYTQLVWNPGDYSVSLAGLNDTFTRTFGVVAGPTGDLRAGDGLEVMGRVSLTYNAVPEPTVLTLLVTGIVGLLAYAWRKRR